MLDFFVKKGLSQLFFKGVLKGLSLNLCVVAALMVLGGCSGLAVFSLVGAGALSERDFSQGGRRVQRGGGGQKRTKRPFGTAGCASATGSAR